MTTYELVKEFIQGAEKGKASGGRLYIEGNKLMNYNTCLAEASGGVWYLNMTKYSRTTTTHQNRLHRELLGYRVLPVVLDDVPIGAQDLKSYASITV
jgi:hypothetical protein